MACPNQRGLFNDRISRGSGRQSLDLAYYLLYYFLDASRPNGLIRFIGKHHDQGFGLLSGLQRCLKTTTLPGKLRLTSRTRKGMTRRPRSASRPPTPRWPRLPKSSQFGEVARQTRCRSRRPRYTRPPPERSWVPLPAAGRSSPAATIVQDGVRPMGLLGIRARARNRPIRGRGGRTRRHQTAVGRKTPAAKTRLPSDRNPQ